ncbi:MAG: RecQ family ATP-dependent DNA helicase [Ignavibacteriaceae bacterium]|jgi:ATP-dependent DNA helicase RecQ|nr:RecQ family ATP-dependent DNA helicase [Ignavibacteriaceae bacterium]
MTRKEAEIKLKSIFGFEKFYDEQWKTIDLLLKGNRVLLIEKTGFGKSLCYQFPAIIFEGLTIIFSPLIALMRDQVRSLNEKGIQSRFINSEQSPEENKTVIQEALAGKIKILYIAPERQENQEWIEATRSMKLSMIVIDEAHTISIWGHDFRPAFRRIINLVELLPKGLPVLATTATATKIVEADVQTQIGNNVTTIRGNLMRENFNLFVIEVRSEDEKLIWLAEKLNRIEGNGIIYTGTRINTEIYSNWLNFMNISCIRYNARLEAAERKEIELGLMNNRWKCVVTTNALGMGIDKPDIRFIIHTQIPASPIHYYQEIGRAGRDGKPANIILFFNSTKDDRNIFEDSKLQLAFIEGSRPSIAEYENVITTLKNELLSQTELYKKTNLNKNKINVIKADLIDQKIIKEVNNQGKKKYQYQHNAPPLNSEIFRKLREKKLKELEDMICYVNTKNSRMDFLCSYLGDTNINGLKNCDNTNYNKRIFKGNKEIEEKLVEFRESNFPELIIKENNVGISIGIAASYYGDTNVGKTIHKCKYENGGDFPDYLLELTLKAFRKKYGTQKYDYICYIPPTESGELVKNFVIKLGEALKIPVTHKLKKTKHTNPQKVFNNINLKKDNIQNVFKYELPSEINNKSIIIFDDIWDSGATIKEVRKLLIYHNAKTITSLVIAKTIGGDI